MIRDAWKILREVVQKIDCYAYFGPRRAYNKAPWSQVQLDGWYTRKELSLIIAAMDAAQQAEKDKP